jgi:hypothetical protein
MLSLHLTYKNKKNEQQMGFNGIVAFGFCGTYLSGLVLFVYYDIHCYIAYYRVALLSDTSVFAEHSF